MQQFGLWHLTDAGPQALAPADSATWQQLVEWVERDPAVLAPGLMVVGRDVDLGGGMLDLLALDERGRWVGVLVEHGEVGRAGLARAATAGTLLATATPALLAAQLHAYLAAVDDRGMRPLARRIDVAGARGATRDVRIVVVGLGRVADLDHHLTCVSDALGTHFEVVTFALYEVEPGRRVLVREGTSDGAPEPRRIGQVARRGRVTVETTCSAADTAGVGRAFRTIQSAAAWHGLHVRARATSLMFASPSQKTRALFTIWTEPKGAGMLRMFVSGPTFAALYRLPEDEVTTLLGGVGWRMLSTADAHDFVAGLNRLFLRARRPGA
ncbi:MAG: hypothetical protein IT305_05450 [Chloroflexi bacterium]|nr:hypothetical protein [Chloroflexota bacterium]